MAVTTSTQILVDTTKRAVVKVVGAAVGAGDQANTTVVTANNLLNARVTTVPANQRLLDIKQISYSVAGGANAFVQLYWVGANAASNTVIANLTGTGYLPNREDGVLLKNNAPGANGDIGIATFGFVSNSAYTIILDINKTAAGFDPGRANDAVAFNF